MNEQILSPNQKSLKSLMRTLEMSEGQFSLLIVCCNYSHLREAIVQELQQINSVDIRELWLPSSVRSLYSTIHDSVINDLPSALMVFGLEGVNNLEQLLISTNHVREDFRNNFPFPLVLWLNDSIMKKMMRLVTDIESWATSITFSLDPDELISFVKGKTQSLISVLLEGNSWRSSNVKILGEDVCQELEYAVEDLQNYQIILPSYIQAALALIRGRENYTKKATQNALVDFQKSWELCQNPVENLTDSLWNLSLFKGLVLFHIGLCYRRLSESQPLENHSLQLLAVESQHKFEECLRIFEQENRPDLVSKVINQLGEVLQQLQEWESLWTVAVKGREVHQSLGSLAEVELAQSYSFLAEVALHKNEWLNAQELSCIAIEIIDKVINQSRHVKSIYHQHKGLYLWLLAQSEEKLGLFLPAIHHLEIAHSELKAYYNPRLYLKILDSLKNLYFAERHYLKSFQIKQEYRTTEHLYGLRAFIGAGRLQPHREVINPSLDSIDSQMINIADEISASGRLQDVNRLMERISSTQHKLTIIYGQSGVGKSSMVMAGLLPALHHKMIESRKVLPVLLQVYKDWVRDLKRKLLIPLGNAQTFVESERRGDVGDWGETSLGFALKSGYVGDSETSLISPEEGVISEFPPIDPQQILEQLEKNSQENILTVLIFDQFEEFFFVCKHREKRKQFFDFLRNCLNILYVKVIFSLRDDCLHYLLEFSRGGSSQDVMKNAIMSDILSKDILYYIGNFTQEDTHAILQSLTNRSQFYLESELIHQLVQDLAIDSGEVRPIELQVVGAQLQQEGIRTLQEYQKLGENPKQTLVERFLQEVIQDCGEENEFVAQRILYILTDEDETRPLKTRIELELDLSNFHQQDKLDLVLEILEKSGLLFRWVDDSSEFYQLVHDYLVPFIRQQQERMEQENIQRLKLENAENRARIVKLLEQEKLSQELLKEQEKRREVEERLSQSQKRRLQVAIGGLIVLTGLAGFAFSESQKAQTEAVRVLDTGSEALVENDPLNRLELSIKLGGSAEQNVYLSSLLKTNITERLQESVSGIQELNSFEKHTKGVLAVAVSPDGKTIASGSADHHINLWNPQGFFLKTLDNRTSVYTLSFSPDGQILVAGGNDGMVTLWNIKTGKNKVFQAHSDAITKVVFSPDGKTLATASFFDQQSEKVKLWDLNGNFQKELIGHQKAVFSVNFSPDGKYIASGGADRIVKLWTREGKLIKNFPAHNSMIYSVVFSPDSKMIASSSKDNTGKIWEFEKDKNWGLKGHHEDVTDISFSPDGKTLASVSNDDTIKIWDTRGFLLQTLQGHRDDVKSIVFSPDGTMITGSVDQTIKLWRQNKTPLTTLLIGHNDWVHSVNSSPVTSGKSPIIASSGTDKTVRLWNPNGQLRNTLTGHKQLVGIVAFSPLGNLLASGSKDGSAKLWNLQGDELKTLKHDDGIVHLSFDPQGEFLATASTDQTVKLWKLKGDELGVQLQTLFHNDSVAAVNFYPYHSQLFTNHLLLINQNYQLIASIAGKTVYFWGLNRSTRKTRLLHKLEIPNINELTGVNFSSDGKFFALMYDKKVSVWRFPPILLLLDQQKKVSFQDFSPYLLTTLEHSERVSNFNFSPNRQLIATSSDDYKVRIWKIHEDQITLETTVKPNVRIQNVSFSADGKVLLLASKEKTVVLWPLENLKLNNIVQKSCQWIHPYWQNSDPKLQRTERRFCP